MQLTTVAVIATLAVAAAANPMPQRGGAGGLGRTQKAEIRKAERMGERREAE
jgi:hypothetical protein